MEEAAFGAWLDAYGRAWESADVDRVSALFAEDAIYYTSPFKEPRHGRAAIVDAWLADTERQSRVRFHHRAVSVAGDIGIARWWVSYIRGAGFPARVHMDGVLICCFDAGGRCVEHREWYARQVEPLLAVDQPAEAAPAALSSHSREPRR